ncbi:WXG100 family type VII secretion target [Streptacidiphilus rugosus]|uniref:WXG100 family type VII secretion target n=1 Tax=Streptacidiphilus rugosus TaxID=405783 RepID=UPI00056738DF|nr:WXG100 family type VII secretion target [Streptacidiphilus rugosus]
MDINGAIAGKVAQVLSLLDLPWPGGDPAALRRFAGEWRAMAGELSGTADRLDGRVHSVVGSSWRGSAADAFAAHWKQQHEAMQHSVQNFEAVAKELDAYADEAQQIIEAIVEIALEIAEFELAGALLTVFTLGASDAIAAAASGERAWKITQLVDRFIKLAAKAGKVITELLNDIRKLGLLPRIAVDALKNTAMNLLGTGLTDELSGQGGLKGSDWETAALAGVGGAAVSGVADRIGSKLVGDDAEDPSKISLLLQGKGTGQNMVIGGLSSAAGGAFADGVEGKDGRTIIADTATSGITGAGGAGVAGSREVDPLPSSGRHAKPGEKYTPLPFELGANGGVYGAGGALEGAVNNNPTLPAQPQGADGAVQASP